MEIDDATGDATGNTKDDVLQLKSTIRSDDYHNSIDLKKSIIATSLRMYVKGIISF